MRPNLLFIHTDQQHFQALSALGCEHVSTPSMDRLTRRGITFGQSYCAVPVCCPSRACWYTGRTASENGVVTNQHKLVEDLPDLGQWFGERGYFPVYTGKWHVPGRDPSQSFTALTANPSNLGEHCDPAVSRSAEAFLRSYDGDKPFFLNVGFLQPHDCCHWRIGRPEDVSQLPYGLTEDDLPPAPETLRLRLKEPPTMSRQLERVRQRETPLWSDLMWRYYIWAYYRQVEMVDAEIGRVIHALDSSAFAENTVVVFTSDHGDGLGRHGTGSKFFLYDEATRVPLVICLPGVKKDGRLDNANLTSGLDIAPTLCDFAGIEPLPKSRGASLRPLIEGGLEMERDFIVSESNITGRMVRTSDYKLITYPGESPEMLFDMNCDPLETVNLAGELPAVVRDLKQRLDQWESRLQPAAIDR
jgi:arylsulfatase A-like enzyme